MAKCLNCGIETDYCLCNACRSKVDIEDLCRRIIEYKPGSGENPLWDQIASEMASIGNFRNVVFALADDLPSPGRSTGKFLHFPEYMRVFKRIVNRGCTRRMTG